MTAEQTETSPVWRLIATLCAAQVMVQIGAFFWPALLPRMIPLWDLTNTEAGWITAIFYGAYMVSVPVLVTLTDRVDPKRIYLFGVGATVVSSSPSLDIAATYALPPATTKATPKQREPLTLTLTRIPP